MPEANEQPNAPESDKSSPPPSGGDPRLSETETKLQQTTAALTEERDKRLRQAAEFENIRRRLTTESQRAAESKKNDFIQQALSIADNLEIALLTPETKETVEHLRSGVRMTLDKFYQLLREHGVEKFASLDKPFDPHRHEAVSATKVDGKPDQTVVQVFREGYTRGDQVFRHAQVVVNQH